MPAEVKHTPLPSPPWNISKRDAPAPMEPLGGQFAIRTDLKGSYLTAVGGGGKTTDVIHTDAINPLAWEEFKFWVDSAKQHYAFQTVTGNFITAVDAGGRTTDTIHSDATAISTWEMFQLLAQSALPNFAIQTLRGFFLTAVGGGGHNTADTIHTDALQASEWERFNIVRRLDFGTGSTYGIASAFNPKNAGVLGGWLTATDGGNLSGSDAIFLGAGAPFWMYWTLLKQDDGTYAFQTASGNVLTANDGGLPGAGFRTDTAPDDIGNFEKFTIEDNGEGSNFTALIKTYAGTYLSVDLGEGQGIATVSNPNEAISWQFQVFSL
ncbi:MAG: hypothetical protein WBW76_03265 [Candidatus Cybelea sp.]